VNPFDIFLPVWLPFVTFLENGLSQIADFTNSGGFAIIIFTIGLKLLLTPFSLMQTKSMKAMQALQPEIAAIKKKFPRTANGWLRNRCVCTRSTASIRLPAACR
jgi:membrane protein insertase Oxa1/YidC/SpoIIIJ